MSTLYIQYPQSGGGGSTGSQTGVPYVVGPLNGAAKNAQGGTIGSFSFYQQTADATFPGLVSSTFQAFAGVKTFNDGFVSLASISMSSKKISNLLDPTTAQEAATKNYVDTQLAAFQPLEAVSLASTVNYPGLLVANVLTITATGAISVDGSTPAANDRILLKNQTSQEQNGVYVVTTVGTIGVSPVLTRAADYNTAAAVNSGASIPVLAGAVNKITAWIQTATVTTLNTDPLVFTQFAANPQNVPIAMGALDSAAASVNGGVIGSSSLYLQSAQGNTPGLVSSITQAFAGVKKFSNQVTVSNGSLTSPSVAFSIESASGMYYIGTSSYAFAVAGVQAMSFTTSSGGAFGNVGMGGAASTSPLFPLSASRTQDGGFLTLAFSNISSVAGSGGRFQALVDNGVNSAEVIATSVNTAAPDVYAGGKAVFRSAGNMTGMNFLMGAADGTVKFYVGPNGTVGEVKATVGSGGLYVQTMVTAPIHRIGSTSVTSSTGAGSYTIVLPGSQSSSSQTLINDGLGRLSWGSIDLSGISVIGSISLANQVRGTFNSLTIGSVTQTSSTGGAVYTVRWPGAQGGAGTTNINDGAGNMSWQSILTNPTTTGGDIIVSSGGGILSRLSLGSTGLSLVVDPTQPYSVGWGNPRAVQQRTVGSDYSIQTTDQFIFVNNSTSTTVSLTLPSATGADGLMFTVTKTDFDPNDLSNVVLIKTVSSQSISYANISSTSVYCQTLGESYSFLAAGGNYKVTNHITDTAWETFTPRTTQGIGSITSQVCIWRRTGTDNNVLVRAISGTATNSEAQFGMPSDGSDAITVGRNVIGTVTMVGNMTANNTNAGQLIVLARNGLNFTFANQNGTNVGLSPLPGTSMVNNTTVFSFKASYPAEMNSGRAWLP